MLMIGTMILFPAVCLKVSDSSSIIAIVCSNFLRRKIHEDNIWTFTIRLAHWQAIMHTSNDNSNKISWPLCSVVKSWEQLPSLPNRQWLLKRKGGWEVRGGISCVSPRAGWWLHWRIQHWEGETHSRKTRMARQKLYETYEIESLSWIIMPLVQPTCLFPKISDLQCRL